jgi:hypothetical protein
MSTALRNARRSYHFPSHRVNREPPVNGNTALSANVGQLRATVRRLMARFVVDCGVVLRLAGDGLAVPDKHESCSRRFVRAITFSPWQSLQLRWLGLWTTSVIR